MPMKIEVAGDSASDSTSSIVISHDGKRIDWIAAEYERGNDRSPEAVFRHINEFWAYLPKNRQDAIFGVYEQIKEVLETVFDHNRLHSRLIGLVKDLYEQMPLEDFARWINFSSDIRVPSNIKDEYGPGDTVERTYLRSHYQGLIMLALALRPMVPIWSEYISRIKNVAGNNYKEFRATGLLARAPIMHCIEMKTLYRYIETNAPVIMEGNGDTSQAASTIGGLGTAQMPEWLLALVLVRRVSVGDLESEGEKGTIISNVHKYISSTIKSLDRRFKGKVRNKEQISDSDDDNASIVENYKVKQDVSDGDLVALSIYSEQVVDIAHRIDPSIDPANINKCLSGLSRLYDKQIHQHQITICQWVVHPTISARGVPFLQKKALLRIMGVVQAALWHWGYPDLAVLMSAIPVQTEGDTMIAGSEGRNRIPRDQLDELVKLYPYYQQLSGKQQGERNLNVAGKAIDALARDLTEHEWQLVACDELVAQVSGVSASGRMLAPPDIKNQLAKLITDIAKRNAQCSV